MTQKRVLFVHSFEDFTSLFLNLPLKKFFRFSSMIALKGSTIRLRRSIEDPFVKRILLILSEFLLAVFYVNSMYLNEHMQWNLSVAFVILMLISFRKDRPNSYLERNFLLLMKFPQGKLFHTLKSQNWYVESLKNYFKIFTNTCVFLVFQIMSLFLYYNSK